MEKKIKIDVITLHSVQNYGSALQAFATQELFKQHSCDVTIINYIRADVRYENLVKKWSEGNPIKALAIIPTIIRWKRVFQTFTKQFLTLTTIFLVIFMRDTMREIVSVVKRKMKGDYHNENISRDDSL